MMTLWRIQSRTNQNRGCFIGRDSPAERAHHHGFSGRLHPAPYEEGHNLRPGDYCAFPTLREFRRWFSTKAQRQAVLKHEGFTLVRLTVTEAVILDRQAVFQWEHVTEIVQLTNKGD